MSLRHSEPELLKADRQLLSAGCPGTENSEGIRELTFFSDGACSQVGHGYVPPGESPLLLMFRDRGCGIKV